MDCSDVKFRDYSPEDFEVLVSGYHSHVFAYQYTFYTRSFEVAPPILMRIAIVSIFGFSFGWFHAIWPLLLHEALLFFYTRELYVRGYYKWVMANHFNDPSLKNFLTHPDDKLSMMVRIGDSDTILGYVAVTAMKDNKEANPTIKTAQISRLTVFPQFRRRGLGRLLTKHAEDYALSRGYNKLYLETMNIQTPAWTMYLKLGFKIAEVQIPTGRDLFQWMVHYHQIRQFVLEKDIS